MLCCTVLTSRQITLLLLTDGGFVGKWRKFLSLEPFCSLVLIQLVGQIEGKYLQQK